MIVYKYKAYNSFDMELNTSDDGPGIIKVNSSFESGPIFLNVLESYVNHVTKTNISLKGKKILDVGMGNGNILNYISNSLDTNIYGVDLNNQLSLKYYKPGFTFPNTDVRDLPKEFDGTFDLIYQRLLSVPFKDTLSVLKAISKLLKKDGIYVVTFDDDFYSHDDSFVVSILKELYEKVDIRKRHDLNIILGCAAMNPNRKAKLTPVDNYYYTLSDEEYNKYIKTHNSEEGQKILEKAKRKINH